MDARVLDNIVANLTEGKPAALSASDFPAFGEGAVSPAVTPDALTRIASALTQDDAPTFARALEACRKGELAWLGFRIVTDPEAAVKGNPEQYEGIGSADALPLAFFANDAKEVVASRAYSDRDLFQMLDVTRGPSLHTDQFAGVTWVSVPLFSPVRVWLLGTTEVARELAALADHVGFKVTVVDCDESFLTAERFPNAERVLLGGGNFDELENLDAAPEDYVCVLTRGHLFDTESCVWALRHHVHYVGMMGSAGKNDFIHDEVLDAGCTEAEWERVKRPIGLKFGAKTPAELAIAIAAELIDVRYRQRYSDEARQAHEHHLGRA